MPDSDDPRVDRGRGILTKTDRQFLLGQVSYEGQQLRNRRGYIRERIANGIIDFSIINDQLNPRDRNQIFSDIDYEPGQGIGNGVQASVGFLLPGIVDTLSYLYKGSADQNVPFEILVERGVRKAINQERGAEFGVLNVDLDIEYVDQGNIESLVEDLIAGKDISSREAEVVMRYLFRNPEVVDDEFDKEEIARIITNILF